MQEMWKTRVQSLGWEDTLEKETATHSSILVWEIPWRVETGRLHTVHRVAESDATEWLNTHTHTHTHTHGCYLMAPVTYQGWPEVSFQSQIWLSCHCLCYTVRCSMTETCRWSPSYTVTQSSPRGQAAQASPWGSLFIHLPNSAALSLGGWWGSGQILPVAALFDLNSSRSAG